MARKQTLEIAQNEGMERLIVSLVSKLAVLAPPWIVGVLIFILGAISHAKWGAPPAVTWATMAGTLATAGLTLLTYAVSHHRGALGRPLSTATTAATGLWFTVATITGVTTDVTFGMMFFGGTTLAIGWNIRAVIRTSDGESGVQDPLGNLFDKFKPKAGLDGARVRTKQGSEHKVKGELNVPDGKTVDDVQKKLPVLEAAAGVPVGSFQMAGDPDNAGKASFTVTDPRVMRRPLPWPGAYAPGASIAEALRIALSQDMDPVLHAIVGHHLQIMGMSGSGKSIGACWNYLAEIITRYDVAVLAADITKGEQTLGPLRPALHRFETTKEGVRRMIDDIHREVKARTDWLSERGYQKWVEGCGLTYWVIWLEECPDILDALGDTRLEKTFMPMLKAIRSAGGTVVMSLQRSDYSQMPTLARGQLAHMCMGVANSQDASFGLSEAQQEREARPELWANKQPGMAYLDAPSIPDTHIAMPLRTYAWGKTDQESSANIRQHVAQWPAKAKEVCAFTTRVADPSGSAALPGTGGAIPMPPAGTGTATAVLDRSNVGDDYPGDWEPEEDSAALEMLATAAEMVVAAQFVSTDMLQRKLRLSHADCLRILEALERKEIIGPDPKDPAVNRKVLVSVDDIEAGSTAIDDLRDEGDAVSEYQRTADPSPEITAGPDDEIVEPTLREDPFHVSAGQGRKLPPAEARGLVYAWIRQRAGTGARSFVPSDPELTAIRERAGYTSRGWIYKVLRKMADAGVLEETEAGFAIVSIDALDELERDGGSES